MRTELLAACCRGISPLTTAMFCSLFGEAGADAYVQFPVFFKNGGNIAVGNGVQIGYGTRMLLGRKQSLRIGEGTVVESFVEFEPGSSIVVGANCIIPRGTRVPAGARIADGTEYGEAAFGRTQSSMRPNARDILITALVVLGIVLFAASVSWVAWMLLAVALLLCGDDVIAPALCVIWLVAYLGTVGWGEQHTFGADNLVFALIVLVAVGAFRWIATTAPVRLRRPNRPETNA